MSFSVENLFTTAARMLAFGCLTLGLAGLPIQTVQARSIEFSVPDGSLTATNAGALTTAPDLIDAYGLRKNSSLPGASGSLQPLPPRGRFIAPQNTQPRGTATSKNWTSMTSDELMQSIVQRDILKTSDDSSTAGLDMLRSSSLFHHDSPTNRASSFDWGTSSATNRFGFDSGRTAGYDPFGSSFQRNPNHEFETIGISQANSDPMWNFLHKPETLSPEAVKQRAEENERAEAFRKLLEISVAPASTASQAAPGSSSTRPRFGFNTPASENDWSLSPRAASSVSGISAPEAPVAPVAPVAPGQLPTTTYTPPPKPKPANFQAPKRRF